ncbi:MAG: biotin-dependent carboxyltransferase [Rhodocyclaceae bacterium]|nr:biotin-dependent carboxyltransferase [Rhodocyclaceae bacterium]MBX3668851.1 biotin-dependent carboxyltransferase [Rhodocyclaceae bacterium]
MSFVIEKCGGLLLMQGRGRWEYQHLGVPVGGPVDHVSARLANWVCGNEDDANLLEIGLGGLRLRALGDVRIAVAGIGAEMDLRINGSAVPPGRMLWMEAGSLFELGYMERGRWVYIATPGGFAAEQLLGSAGSLTRAGLGRSLEVGDPIETYARDAHPPGPRWKPMPGGALAPRGAALQWLHLQFAGERAIRVVPDAREDLFSAAAIAAFYDTTWRLSPQIDRMGYRLDGTPLPGRREQIISGGVTFGTIQVSGDGKPIILMADRQPTGGYPCIAHVASVDLPRVAQLNFGEAIQFERIDSERAEDLLLVAESYLAQMRESLLSQAGADA